MITSNCYFSSDFDYDAYTASDEVQLSLRRLPPIAPRNEGSSSSSHSSRWGSFYSSHAKGLVYKPRKYLYNAFKPHFDAVLLGREPGVALTILEVGCGYGCSLVPLAELLRDNSVADAFLVASDYSEESLDMLRSSSHFKEHSKSLFALRWDVTEPFDTSLLPPPCPRPSLVLCVFALSAVPPEDHLACLRNVAALMSPGGRLLLRDYAFGDLTMFRHKSRVGELLFQRGREKTLAFYFTSNHLFALVAALGGLLVMEELQMCTVRLRNRGRGREGGDMRRCFVHCVLRKVGGEEGSGARCY